MRKKFQLPRPGTTLTCRPASTPVTHNEACMKLRRLHPRCERPSCPTLSTPSSSISSNGSARAHAPIAKSSRPGGRRVRAWRFGKPLRNVASSPANLHRKAAPELRFPPLGQSTCAGIAAPSPTPTLKPLRRHAENGCSGLSLDKRDTPAKTEHPRREAERDRGGDRRLCRQDAQGPTPPTFSIVITRAAGQAAGNCRLRRTSPCSARRAVQVRRAPHQTGHWVSSRPPRSPLPPRGPGRPSRRVPCPAHRPDPHRPS